MAFLKFILSVETSGWIKRLFKCWAVEHKIRKTYASVTVDRHATVNRIFEMFPRGLARHLPNSPKQDLIEISIWLKANDEVKRKAKPKSSNSQTSNLPGKNGATLATVH